MENNLKVCGQCNTVNDITSKFCRNCGAEFKEQPIVINTPQPVADNTAKTDSLPFDSNGVSIAEFEAYVGKNKDRFIPHFKRFCRGDKASFSPLVFLLTLLISPVVSAFWFLHRKMYKIGSIVLAIGLLLTLASGVIGANVVSEASQPLKEYMQKVEDGANSGFYYDYEDFLESPEYRVATEEYVLEVVEITAKYNAFSSALNMLNIGLAVLLGIFAKYLYFSDAVKKILSIKQENPTPSSIYDISEAGGTANGVWVACLIGFILGIICYFFALLFSLLSNIIMF